MRRQVVLCLIDGAFSAPRHFLSLGSRLTPVFPGPSARVALLEQAWYCLGVRGSLLLLLQCESRLSMIVSSQIFCKIRTVMIFGNSSLQRYFVSNRVNASALIKMNFPIFSGNAFVKNLPTKIQNFRQHSNCLYLLMFPRVDGIIR